MTTERIDLGAGHSFEWTFGDADTWPELFPERSYVTDRGKKVVLVGMIEYHSRPDGSECAGSISFCRPLGRSDEDEELAEIFEAAREANRPVWTVESLEPLTLSPSVLCTPGAFGCGAHGFIRSGRWVSA